MTISEVGFIPDHGIGECPVCKRADRQLGICNAMPIEDEDGYPVEGAVRCIDCFFGIPCEYWIDCAHCGTWGPGFICEKCGKPQRPEVRDADIPL